MRFELLLVLGAIGTNGLAVRASPKITAVRSDGRCGLDFNWAGCGVGSCCSQYGWCGTSAAHCTKAGNCQLGCKDGPGTIALYQGPAIVSSSSSTSLKATPSSSTAKPASSSSSTSKSSALTTLTTGTSKAVSSSSTTSTTSTSSTMKFTSSSSSSSFSTFISSTISKITSSSSSSSAVPTSTGGPKAVFAHYMVGGMTSDEATKDVQQAKAMGLDAFALNVQTTDAWCTSSISYLFAAAQAQNFKMFFSFDMESFQTPSAFIPLLQKYYGNSAYYTYGGLPMVSTFYGGKLSFGASSANAGWQLSFKDVMSAAGMPVYFVPAFNDAATTPSSFFSSFPVVDGQFNWDGSWPYASQGLANCSSSDDQTYITKAKAAGKTFMMGLSALQFKHMDSSNNWYRRGGLSLALRIPQILAAQPDFVEIQTWNDAGESHYIGPVWPEAIAGSTIPAYTDGYDHSGWQQLLSPFTAAFKSGATSASALTPTNGKSVQGVFWHSTLLTTAKCSGDSMGKPSGSDLLQDVVEVAVVVAKTAAGGKANVYSGGRLIGSYPTVTGLNAWEVPGLTTGNVKVEVLDAAGNSLTSATGSMKVVADSTFCNYNPQVVGL